VLIGGGAGMAPLRAMILDLLSVRNDPRRIAFFYGARNTPDLIFLAEFETLAARHSNFSIDCAISNGEGAEGRWPVSHIHELAREKITEAGSRIEIASCEFYLCGPPIMLAATEAMLAELGVNKERIFIDDFGI
jgi:Na+-transporting NADH:ubiquinone oxidoreductase subunit F